jgi:hypothetical protein
MYGYYSTESCIYFKLYKAYIIFILQNFKLTLRFTFIDSRSEHADVRITVLDVHSGDCVFESRSGYRVF